MFPEQWGREISCEEAANSSELQTGLKPIKNEATSFEQVAGAADFCRIQDKSHKPELNALGKQQRDVHISKQMLAQVNQEILSHTTRPLVGLQIKLKMAIDVGPRGG